MYMHIQIHIHARLQRLRKVTHSLKRQTLTHVLLLLASRREVGIFCFFFCETEGQVDI